MRVLNCDEIDAIDGASTDYGPIVACTFLSTVGIAVGAVTAGPAGFGVAYFAALLACNY